MKPVICPNRCKVIHRQNLASMRDSGRFCEKIANTRKVLRKIRKKKGRRVKGTPAGFPQRFASAPPPATQAGLRPRTPTSSNAALAARGTTQGPQRGQSRNPREPHFVSVQTARPCLSKPLLHEHRAPLPNPPYSGGRNSRFIQTGKQGSKRQNSRTASLHAASGINIQARQSAKNAPKRPASSL